MSDWWTIGGTILTFLFGMTTLLQWLKLHFQNPQLHALRRSVFQVRALCVERAAALDAGGTQSTSETRRMLADIAHALVTIEHQVDGLLGVKATQSKSNQCP